MLRGSLMVDSTDFRTGGNENAASIPDCSQAAQKGHQQGRSDLSFIRGGWDDPNCARPTRAFSSRALREHLSCSMIPPSSLVTFFQGVAWLGPQLRTSNDHCFIVGVP